MADPSRRLDALKVPTLSAFLGAANIKIVDIGGRGKAFPGVAPLAAFAGYYVSEPDAEEAARLGSELPLRTAWRSVTVIPEAIATHRGHANLYVTEEPGMSSLLEPDAAVANRFVGGQKFNVESVVTVPTMPLDEAASRYDFADACFLKLDTQGTELDVLRSGSRLVRESVLGVYTEGCFQPFYKGQSLFSDVDLHLRSNGFSLFSVSRTSVRRAGFHSALYSRRSAAWAHSLYLREPETLGSLNPDALDVHVPRLLGLALSLQQYDLALEITTMARRLRLLSEGDGERLAAEVRRTCRDSTCRVLRTVEGRGSTDDPMAKRHRDPRLD